MSSPTPDCFNVHCPSRSVLDIMSDKWTILIIEKLAHNPQLFGELKRQINGISSRVLAQRLKKLEYYGLVVQQNYQTTTLKVEYSLSSIGESLSGICRLVTNWAEDNAIALQNTASRITKEADRVNKDHQQQKLHSVIAKYGLEPHPEGGWYRQTFRSQDVVTAKGSTLARYAGESRSAGTSIIYLLPEGDFSAWHTIQSDETWYFHAGSPLLLHVIEPITGTLQTITLHEEIGNVQYTVRAGHIFSAEPLGCYSLTGCAVTPGFDFKDFRLLTLEEMMSMYPQHSSLMRLIHKPK